MLEESLPLDELNADKSEVDSQKSLDLIGTAGAVDTKTKANIAAFKEKNKAPEKVTGFVFETAFSFDPVVKSIEPKKVKQTTGFSFNPFTK